MALSAQELRIGNLINMGGNTIDTYQTYKPVKVTLAFLWCIVRENEERPDAVLSIFQPIELTEEWLKRFGFEWSIYHQAFHKDGFEFDLNEQFNSSYIFSTFKRQLYIGREIKYVHQLQNLFMCLTGEELTERK